MYIWQHRSKLGAERAISGPQYITTNHPGRTCIVFYVVGLSNNKVSNMNFIFIILLHQASQPNQAITVATTQEVMQLSVFKLHRQNIVPVVEVVRLGPGGAQPFAMYFFARFAVSSSMAYSCLLMSTLHQDLILKYIKKMRCKFEV